MCFTPEACSPAFFYFNLLFFKLGDGLAKVALQQQFLLMHQEVLILQFFWILYKKMAGV